MRLDPGLEPEPDADQGVARRAEYDVRGMQLIVIVTIGQIVDVGVERGVFGNRMLDHRIEDPVSGSLLDEPADRVDGHGGTCGSSAYEAAAGTDAERGRQPVSLPEREGVPGNIG